jgi:hypothetical protein
LLSDLEVAEDPDTVWKPFNARPERQLWYFTGVIDAVERRLGEHALVEELREALARLQPFVTT